MRLHAAMLAILVLTSCASIDLNAGASSAAASADPSLNEWKPEIAGVYPLFPGQSKNIDDSYGVNVAVWPTNPVLCTRPPSPRVGLYVSKNGDPGDLVTEPPSVSTQESGNTSFPAAEFNGVNASLAAEPGAKYHFVLFVKGQPASNVWLHTGSKPNEGGQPIKPTGYSSPSPSALDTRIQVVFPHDEQGKEAPVKSATRVNIAVDVFQHGTTLSVPPDANYTPVLWSSQGGARLQRSTPGVQKTTYTVGSQGYPRWVFNDIHVDPAQTYHFLVMVGALGDQGGSYPSVWTYTSGEPHAPFKPQTPPACIP